MSPSVHEAPKKRKLYSKADPDEEIDINPESIDKLIAREVKKYSNLRNPKETTEESDFESEDSSDKEQEEERDASKPLCGPDCQCCMD